MAESTGSHFRQIGVPARTVACWVLSNAQVIKQTFNVWDYLWVHPFPAGMLEEDHPWITGCMPGIDRTIWGENIVYASPRREGFSDPAPEDDHRIVERIGTFLAAMVARSNIANPEIPHGPKRRMPHAVNYLHGSIHYNGCFVIFNDIPDALRHLSDPRFRREFMRLGRTERREITIVLRERSCHPDEYAWFISSVRSHFIWFANGNGPTKRRVLHGNPSPYPAVNTINGAWLRDMKVLQRGDTRGVIRPPVNPDDWFTGEYGGQQSDFTFLERSHAWMQHLYISAKRFQGGLVFTRRKKIEPENWKKYIESNRKWRASYTVPHPFQRIGRIREEREENSKFKIMKGAL